jgi:UDP-4-amino-4,6-dideoxy-N-acetyl-beta-L-altrosamine transaminase
MTMIPYSTQDVGEAELEAVRAVLASGWLTQGPAVPDFEERMAQLHETAHAVAVSSATAALHLGCLALGAAPGKRVWTSPNSFVASANCALYCGAEVDFVDIDARTRNLSVEALRSKLQAAAPDELPHIVIPVDFSGLPCDYAPLRELADLYGFRILADSSHAVGARYQDAPVGARFADATVFSFHPVKIVTTAEGGMVLTQDPHLAERLRLLRSHGITREPREFLLPADGPWYYEQQSLGYNYRMTDISAALGSAQLQRLDELKRGRLALSRRYDQLLAGLPLIRPCELPDRESSLHLYVIEIDADRCQRSRAQVYSQLRSAGIGCNVHYIPIHLQPFYRALGFKPGDFPAAERYYARALSIPLYPAMNHAQQDRVVEALTSALGAAGT